jgi:methylenetetrahydrofolate dehydrogenase (NADP+)/methenyltetrahydrofolate cyclohydrolase
MAAKIIDGKAISQAVKDEVTKGVAELKEKTGVQAALAVVLVGEDPASQVYVRNKGIACEKCGIKSIEHKLPADTTQAALNKLVEDLNNDDSVHGILVQLPLPKGLSDDEVLNLINPAKDVDGFHPINVGKFLTIKKYADIQASGVFLPCTPHGCIELLDRSGVDLNGANAVVVGRSNIVGKPVSLLLMSKNATVTIAHSRTKDLPGLIKSADVVVAAIGMPEFVKGEWIKPGAAIIDVGINRMPPKEEGGKDRLVGDVEYEAAAAVAGCITPVPGGVGPMTIAMLMKNTLQSATQFAAKK